MSFSFVKTDADSPDARMLLGELNDTLMRVYARNKHAGAGAALMRAVEERARELGYVRLILECREGNAHAIGFYLRNGYALREKYPPYDSEADAVCFEKKL